MPAEGGSEVALIGTRDAEGASSPHGDFPLEVVVLAGGPRLGAHREANLQAPTCTDPAQYLAARAT